MPVLSTGGQSSVTELPKPGEALLSAAVEPAQARAVAPAPRPSSAPEPLAEVSQVPSSLAPEAASGPVFELRRPTAAEVRSPSMSEPEHPVEEALATTAGVPSSEPVFELRPPERRAGEQRDSAAGPFSRDEVAFFSRPPPLEAPLVEEWGEPVDEAEQAERLRRRAEQERRRRRYTRWVRVVVAGAGSFSVLAALYRLLS